MAKAVGDIVFNDGSATPYTAGKRFNDTQKNAAVAIIFYSGTGLNNGNNTGTSRTLGLGLKNKAGIKWCASDANACSNGIDSIKCTPISNNGIYFYDGDLNGSDNFKQLSDALETMNGVNDDTTTEGNYPPFEYAENYSSTATNLNSFNTKWFLPSIAELYQIYACNKDKNNGFDINAALEALGRNKFEEVKFWSASQTEEAGKVYTLDFKTGELVEESKTYIAGYACAIRDFTTYTVTTESTAQVTITADKETATEGEKVTISVTSASPDDYDVTINEITVLNGSEPVPVTNNSFVMPAGNVKVSVDCTFVPVYSITISSNEGGSVEANKTSRIKEGDEITLTVTPETDNKLVSLKMNETTLTVTDNKATFTMPAANVTITATFRCKYIGNKSPIATKDVGDIVFNDGSAMSYSDFAELDATEQDAIKNSAIALIFYKGTGLNSDAADGTPNTTTSRTLGLGFINTYYTTSHDKIWCAQGANAHDKKIADIICKPSGTKDTYTFTGDKNGSDNLKQISDFLKAAEDVDDDTTTQEKYPAFYLAKNYKNEKLNTESKSRILADSEYANGWYIPSIAEMYQIYQWKKSINAELKQVLDDLNAKLPSDNSNVAYWSSSQNEKQYYEGCAYSFNFGSGYVMINSPKHSYDHVCCIREF